MKKLFMTFMALFVYGVAFAGSPVYFPQSTDCFSVYAVGGGTITAATVAVYVSSIEFTSTAGLYPGTTNINFFDANYDTVSEVITKINSLAATVPGTGGGLVATLSQGSYGGNNSSSMTAVAAQSILTATNVKTLATDAAIGISYIIPASADRKVFLENLVINATFSAGTPTLSVYNGSTTNEILRKETLNISGVDGKVDITDNFSSDPDMPMRVDLVGTSVLTNAYMNLIYRYGR